MKWKSNNKYFKWGLTAFWVIAASIIFYYLVFHGEKLKIGVGKFIDILLPIVFGIVISYLLTPVLNYIEYKVLYPICNKLKIKDGKNRSKVVRMISVLVSISLFLVIAYTLIYMLISEIVPSIVNISKNFDLYVDNFTNWLNKILEDNTETRDYVLKQVDRYSVELDNWINNTLLPKTTEFIKTISLSVIGFLKVLWDFIIGLIVSIYLLSSKEKLTGQGKKMIYAFFERPTANIIINNFKFTHKTFGGFISAKVADSIIIGCLCFIGMSILRIVPTYAALISVIIGVTNFIPFFGPFLGAIPCTILIFLVDFAHPISCLYFIIFVLVLQQFDGNILGPKILGESTGLTSFWVIFAITFFGGLFGVLGMIVGVPIMGVIYGAMRSIINARLDKKKLPSVSDMYIEVCSVDSANNLQTYTPEYKLKRNQSNYVEFGRSYISTAEATKKNQAVDSADNNILTDELVDEDDE